MQDTKVIIKKALFYINNYKYNNFTTTETFLSFTITFK